MLCLVFARYSLASDVVVVEAENSTSEIDIIDRVLSDPTINHRGEFGTIGSDGNYTPFDWRIRWLKHFPKISVGYAIWFDDEWDLREGPTIYFNAYTRPKISKVEWLQWMPKSSEYFIPTSLEAGVGNGVGILKFGWLVLPIIDLKIDIGAAYRFEQNLMQDGVVPMIGISLLRL